MVDNKKDNYKPEPLLTTDDLAEHLGKTRRALEKLRKNGTGPDFYVLSPRAVRYKLSDVITWEDAQRRTTATEGKSCAKGRRTQRPVSPKTIPKPRSRSK